MMKLYKNIETFLLIFVIFLAIVVLVKNSSPFAVNFVFGFLVSLLLFLNLFLRLRNFFSKDKVLGDIIKNILRYFLLLALLYVWIRYTDFHAVAFLVGMALFLIFAPLLSFILYRRYISGTSS